MDEHRIDDIIIDITDVDKKPNRQTQHSERDNERPERPRLPTAAKLIALWNLLFELVVGVPYICLMAWVGDDYGMGAVVICVFLFAVVHTAASTAAFRRYNRKYGVHEWEFVLLNALPLFLIGTFMYLSIKFGNFNLGIGILLAFFASAFWDILFCTLCYCRQCLR